MNFTDHSRVRLEQRAIPIKAIDACQSHGQRYYAGDGCLAYYLNNNSVAEAKKLGIDLTEFTNIAVIIKENDDQGSVVITVQHTPRPPKSWRISR